MRKDQLVKTSYSEEDAIVLLKDVSGLVEVLGTEEREARIQSGTHYSEMIPLEYKPSDSYMKIYDGALKELSKQTAEAVAIISEKVFLEKGVNLTLVSLARAGTPVGVLMKRYIKAMFGVDIPHYSVSIIRGKGFDINAMEYIVDNHSAEGVQFVDGWIGKGAICRVLEASCHELRMRDDKFSGLSAELAVISDPAWITDLCGTHDDFLIPSACLNSTVSGLFSRTYLKEGIIGPDDFHGAVYYGNLVDEDKSIEFIEAVEYYFKDIIEERKKRYGFYKDTPLFMNIDKMQEVGTEDMSLEIMNGRTGLAEVMEVADHFGINDINKIKPGVGETTRVLLRRLPWKVLIRDEKSLPEHVRQLCIEKSIPIEIYPLNMYRVCGIIKDLSADA